MRPVKRPPPRFAPSGGGLYDGAMRVHLSYKLVALWLCAAAMLSGCDKPATPVAAAPATGPGATVQAGGGPRIVSKVPAATLNLVLIGGDKHLVGVSSFDKLVLPKDEQDLPVVGDYEQTNYEQL